MSTALYITLAYPSARFLQCYASNTITSPGDPNLDKVCYPGLTGYLYRYYSVLDCRIDYPGYGATNRFGHPRCPNWEAVTILSPSDLVDSRRLSRPTPKAVSDYYQNAQNRLFGQFGPSGPSCLRFLLAHAQESVYKNVARQGCTAVYGLQARPIGEETG